MSSGAQPSARSLRCCEALSGGKKVTRARRPRHVQVAVSLAPGGTLLRPVFLVVVDQAVRRRVVARHLARTFELRQDRLGELLAELDAPLVEAVDVPDHA